MENMNIETVKQEITLQEQENMRLFEIFQYRLQDAEMQPMVHKWREGSKRVKSLICQLQILEDNNKSISVPMKDNSAWVDELPQREITSAAYIRADRRLSKQIMSFIS